MSANTYKAAGVDIAAGNDLVAAIAPLARATARPGADPELGGFGGLFDLKAAGYTDPILVAATDGVGTKLRFAIDTGIHDTIGIDLVAMSVNDIVAQGAEPLFFLDYFATGRLEPAVGAAVVAGIAAGCRAAGCALIGGETAEMPGIYAGGDYDIAGFAVGACERGAVLPNPANPVAAGDVIVALPSAGLHANGFSLVHHIIAQQRIDTTASAPFANTSLAEALLTPTRILTGPARAATATGKVKAIAHITGGGVIENIPRTFPATGLTAVLDGTAWPTPPVFAWLAETGSVAPAEMLRTFNCGVAMVAVVAGPDADAVCAALTDAGDTPTVIGHVADTGDAPVVVEHPEAACGL